MTAGIAALIEQARDGDPDAARELADLVERVISNPDRRVGSALTPKRRGEPEWRAEQRVDRDSGYRDLAVAEYGTVHLTPRQAAALARNVKRLLAAANVAEGGGDARQQALRRIRTAGLGAIGARQLLRVLPRVEKKL